MADKDEVLDVEPQKPGLATSPIGEHKSSGDDNAGSREHAVCFYNGVAYSMGAKVRMNGQVYFCEGVFGWVPSNEP